MSLITTMMLLPILGSILIAASSSAKAQQAKVIALGTSLLVAALSIWMALQFKIGKAGYQFIESHHWISGFNINYAVGVDGLALVLIVMAAVLVPITLLAGWFEAEGGRFSVKTFYILILILETMMIGVFAATDIFLFYVLFEAMLLPVYFLIGGFGRGERAAAAMKFLLYSLFGGLLMLAALIGLFINAAHQVGLTFDITQLSQLQISHGTQNWLFLGFFIAFAIKAPLWPFHTWLPQAARSAQPGTSILLLGVLDKVGTYGMIRFCMALFPDATRTFTPLIITLSVISILYGAFLAIGQKDMNALIAFMSISHFGFITLGIFAMTSQGLTGSILYMVNHGVSTAALFMTAGWMAKRRNSSQIADFGGLQRITPVLAWCFFIAGLSALALPGLSSFISEFLVLVGTFTRYPVAAIFGTLGIVLAALYVLIAVQRTLHGESRGESEGVSDLVLREKVAMAPVIALLVLMGFFPKPVIDAINPSSASVMSHMQVSDPAPKAGR